MLHSEWLHFWSNKENAALVIKGREDFHSLSQSEKFQIEQFIKQRMRLFGSALPTVQIENGWKIIRLRAKDFFSYPGSMAFYQSLKEKELIAIPWMNFIDDTLKS